MDLAPGQVCSCVGSHVLHMFHENVQNVTARLQDAVAFPKHLPLRDMHHHLAGFPDVDLPQAVDIRKKRRSTVCIRGTHAASYTHCDMIDLYTKSHPSMIQNVGMQRNADNRA